MTNSLSFHSLVLSLAASLIIPFTTSAEPATVTAVPPVILTEPQDQTEPVGSNVTFFVVVDSSSASYQWRKNGANLSGQTKSNLTLTKLTPLNAGNYSVKVTASKTNTVSRSAVLTVTPAGPLPVITTQPKSLVVAQGARATFSVSVTSTTPKGYQWLYNGNPITKATAASYAIAKSQFTNAGEYSVIVTNWGGAVTSSVGVLTVVGELVKPTLTVTNTAAKVYLPTVTLGGKASDKSGILSVSYSWNNSEYQPVIGTTNWVTDPITLAVGSNVFKVKATDVWTNETVVTKNIYYVYTSPLTVEIIGSGKVTPDINGKFYELGKKLSLKATPAANCLFKEWVVGGITNTNSSATLSFTMSSNLVVDALFVTNPAYFLQGNYAGVIVHDAAIGAQTSGFFTMSVKSTGAFSSKLQFGGDTYSFSGSFNANGCTTNYLQKNGVVKLVSVWELDYESLGNIIVGTVYYGSSEYSSAGGYREIYNAKTNPAPYAGKYTMVIPGTNYYGTNTSGVPMGDGYACVTIDPSGTISFAGKLADNTSVTASSYVSSYGQCPFFVSLAKGSGMLFGILDVSTNLSEVYWVEPAKALTLYPLGFTNYTYLNWSPLSTPTNGDSALTLTNGQIVFSGGNLTEPLTNALVFSGKNQFMFNATNSFSVNPTNGVIQGTFWHPVLSKTVSFNGIILQEQNTAHGFFTGKNGIGNVLITEQKQAEESREDGK